MTCQRAMTRIKMGYDLLGHATGSLAFFPYASAKQKPVR
jgi:hypothetical protein